ncbi:hypothetical protein Nepgr_024551 [Nepenthes gracilis]|uniref:glutathione transferase n=1 Tax=Nepenthes gracilis TaxID=150966 RepID=A0AAD3XYW9_NEPGR|nr:hypothetical protein Nepgr_024551 [Nepenthes gracilis]
MTLKIYADRMSQPSRAVILFCRLNKIDFEEIRIDISKREHLSPEYQEINPMRKVPAIVDGRFKLFESHAILIYLATAFPGVADHWYPADVSKRSKIHSVLDWHHSNLRHGSMKYILHTVLAPALGVTPNPQVAVEAKKILDSSLSEIDTIWLKGSGKFLLGSYQPSIADLSLVCEIMQLEILDDEDRRRILAPYERVQKWIEATKNSTMPHFDDVHVILFKAKARLRTRQESRRIGSDVRTSYHSKM